MALPSRYWQDLPWPAFRALPADTVAVLPVAAIEQHGPHLPVSVDTTINQGLLTAALPLALLAAIFRVSRRRQRGADLLGSLADK